MVCSGRLALNPTEGWSLRTDGADLVVPDPHSGVRGGRRLDAQLTAQPDDGPLQLTDVPAHTLPEAPEVQDRVADQLARPMEGNQPASVRPEELGSQEGQPALLLGGIWGIADPDGVDRRVFAHQQGVGGRAAGVSIAVPLDEALLFQERL